MGAVQSLSVQRPSVIVTLRSHRHPVYVCNTASYRRLLDRPLFMVHTKLKTFSVVKYSARQIWSENYGKHLCAPWTLILQSFQQSCNV